MELSINIDVPDLGHAIRFYADGLGLRLGRLLFDGTVAEMQGATVPIYLLHRASGSNAAPASRLQRTYARHWTPIHLDLIVADMALAIERATQAGARIEQPSQMFSWGVLTQCSDPFGHGFCLIEWRGKGYKEAECS